MNQETTEESYEESCILIWLTGIVFLVAMGAIFLFVPTEQTEGPVQRIMYIHIPSAWLSFFCIFYCVHLFYSLSLEKGKGVGYLCTCLGWNRCDFLFPGFDNRSYLGKTYLGNLVGLGCALNFDPYFVVDLCSLSDATCTNWRGFHESSLCSGIGYCWLSEYSLYPLFCFMVADVSSSTQSDLLWRVWKGHGDKHADYTGNLTMRIHTSLFFAHGSTR